MELSVIIPTYNRAHLLKRAVRSIPQKVGIEIIVVDDGSTDETKDVVSTIQKERPDVRFLQYRENHGVNYARNFGAKTARGNWVSFLDSDDEYVPGGFDALCSALVDVHADISVAGFMTYREVRGAMEARGFKVGQLWNTYEPSYEEILFKEHIHGDIHYCVRRSIFEEGYGFPEYVNGFELALFAKLAKDGKKFLYMNTFVDRRYAGNYEHLSDEPYRRWPRQFAYAWRLFVREHRSTLMKRPDALQDFYARIGKTMLRIGSPLGVWWIARAVVGKVGLRHFV